MFLSRAQSFKASAFTWIRRWFCHTSSPFPIWSQQSTSELAQTSWVGFRRWPLSHANLSLAGGSHVLREPLHSSTHLSAAFCPWKSLHLFHSPTLTQLSPWGRCIVFSLSEERLQRSCNQVMEQENWVILCLEAKIPQTCEIKDTLPFESAIWRGI